MWTSILVCWGEATNIYIYKQEHTVVNSKKKKNESIESGASLSNIQGFHSSGNRKQVGNIFTDPSHPAFFQLLLSSRRYSQHILTRSSSDGDVWSEAHSPHIVTQELPPPLLSLISKVSNNKNLPKATLRELCWEQCSCPRFFYGICWVLVSVLISLKWFVLFLHSCFSVFYVVFRI